MTVQDTVDEDDEAESVNVASIVYRYSSKSTTFCPEPDDDVLEKEQLDRKKDDYPATATDNNSSNGAMKQHHSDVFHDPQQRHHHDDAVEGSVPLYAPPRQRQRWGDEQVAPHTNWGDIFFDLFYVAASYNLGHVLREDPSWTGLLYVVGLLLPIQNLWATKTYYDSRFYYTDDYWHRIYEMALLVALATAVWYIRPVPRLSHPAELHDMFIFSLSITICYFLALGRLVEIMICQKFLPNQTGLHPEAFVATRRDALGNVLTGLLFTAAAVYSGRQFYNHHNNSEHYHADVPSSSPLSHSNTSTSTAPVNHTRHLSSSSYVAETTYVTEPDNIPIWLLLGGTFAAVAWFFQVVVTFSVVHKEKHKESSVPINVDFVIHRYGEWTMLMLGESILSLMVVEFVETVGYYQVFISGVISIVLLEYLHFQSQPSDPEEHAMRRSIFSSFLFYWLMQIYSCSLLVLGASYKMLLYEFVYTKAGSISRRSLLFTGLDQRWLSSEISAALRFSTEDRQLRIAHFFSVSLFLIFFCLDVMSLAHRGLSANWKRCECVQSHTKRVLAFALVGCRTALMVFIVSLSHFNTSPNQVATIGMFTILAQLILRFVGYFVFHAKVEDAEDQAIDRIINYNTARIHDRATHPMNMRH